MSQGGGSTLWRSRLRWRLRGALQWPLFVVLTLLDALLLGVLPISGRHTGFIAGLLLAMLFNLVAVAGLGRLLALWLRRSRPDLPRIVAEDRVGSALLGVVTLALLAGGIVHTPGRHAEDRAFAAQRDAVRAYVVAHSASIYRANLHRMHTVQQGGDLFRTCVPGDAGAGLPPLCLIVRTGHVPPLVRIDPDRTP